LVSHFLKAIFENGQLIESRAQLTKKPEWTNLQWPNIGDFLDDKDQDMPKEGQLIDEFCYRVSDLGTPVTEGGMNQCEKLVKEYGKRDQDRHDMHIDNDCNGWGMCELLENYVGDSMRVTSWNGMCADILHSVPRFQQGDLQEDGESVSEMGVC